jgi:acyl-CoA synthetase (AMP-forming)/AMP-acid ligase II
LDAPDVSQGARPLRIRGPAVCSATLPPRPFDGEWLRTGDIGALADGELFIAGRTDDLMSFAGRNVFAWELELEAVSSGAVRMGDCAVVRDGEGGYAVFFELRAVGANMHDDAAFHAIRRQLASTMGIGPSFIGALPRGVLPKTSSGKIKRKSLEAMRDAYTEACIECRRF